MCVKYYHNTLYISYTCIG